MNKRAIAKELVENMKPCDSGLDFILRENLSFAQYDRIRLQTDFTTETSSRKKYPATAKFEKYLFDRDQFLNELSRLPHGSRINWTEWARDQFRVTINGSVPSNAGHVLKSYAEYKGIDTSVYNVDKIISGRDIKARTRKSKRKICPTVSLPCATPGKLLKKELKAKIETGAINIGAKVVPNSVETHSGPATDVYARQRFLCDVVLSEVERIDREQLLKLTTGESGQIFVKLWHDHAMVAGRSHFAVMAQVRSLYTPPPTPHPPPSHTHTHIWAVLRKLAPHPL